MQNYVITCCSTVDMDLDFFENNDIQFIPFTFNLDGKSYDDDYGKSYPLHDFYTAMVNGAVPTTSQINVVRYMEFWRPILEKGVNIIHLTLSSGISGSHNSAVIAANTINEEMEAKVTVIDSLAASSGYGMLVKLAKYNLDRCMSYEDNIDWIENHKLNVHHWFFTTDLTYLVRGGRVSKVSGFLGSALKICPLLNVDFEGHLIPRYKLRGKKKVIQACVDKMIENADNGTDYDGYVYISHSEVEDDAREVADLVRANFPKVKEVKIYNIGTVIGAHTGPGTVALFFTGKKRID